MYTGTQTAYLDRTTLSTLSSDHRLISMLQKFCNRATWWAGGKQADTSIETMTISNATDQLM